MCHEGIGDYHEYLAIRMFLLGTGNCAVTMARLSLICKHHQARIILNRRKPMDLNLIMVGAKVCEVKCIRVLMYYIISGHK